jgi:hypothetical protein
LSRIIQSSWFPWVLAAFAVLSANWVASAIEKSVFHLVDDTTNWVWLVRGGFLLIFIAIVCALYKQRGYFFRPRARVMKAEKKPHPRKYLVIFLSDLHIKQGSQNEGIPRGIKLKYDLQSDLATLVRHKKKPNGTKWPWEMPLRAIYYHNQNKKLRNITLVCSRESLPQSAWFQNIVKRYQELSKVKTQILVQKDIEYEITKRYKPSLHHGFDFEAFDDLSEALAYLLKEFRRDGVAASDVVIDFTSGQKPNSVVAAAITLNRDVIAQYVQTNEPWDIIGYKTELPTSDPGSLGI